MTTCGTHRQRRGKCTMLASMAQPKPTPEHFAVPEELQPLVQQLAGLSAEDRRLVVKAAARRAHVFVALSAEDIQKLLGAVAIGGDALEDCDALYDG
jgi:hypothetical protein